MVELLSRPRVFVLVFWVTSMFISGLLGGLMMSFDSGTVMIWLFLTLLGPALVGCMLLVQNRRSASPLADLRREIAQSRVSRRRSVTRAAAAPAPRP